MHRGRGAELVRLLAEYGADPDRAGDERYGNTPLRTPYQHAVLRGDDHVAQTLAALGASTDLGAVDAAVAAFARGRLPASKLPADLDADQQEALVGAAMRGRLEEVLERVGPGFRAALDGSPEGTLLHHAAWYGKADAARRLLARGADPHDRTRADYETPAAWAALGSRWWRTPGADYVGVMEQLVEAGAALEPRFVDVAHGPLGDWLRERLP